VSNVNLTYIRIDLARCFRDVTNLLFTFAMPVFMYLLFGRAQYSDFQSGRGTVGFYVMSSMGAYGAVIAATAIRHDLTLVTRNVRDFAELNVPLLNPFPGKG